MDEGGRRENFQEGWQVSAAILWIARNCLGSLGKDTSGNRIGISTLWSGLKPSESPGRPDRDLRLFRIQGVSNPWDHDDNSCWGRCWAVSLQMSSLSLSKQSQDACSRFRVLSSLGRPFPSSPTLMSDPGQSIHATTWALASPKSCCSGSHGKGSGLELRRDPKREGAGALRRRALTPQPFLTSLGQCGS